MGNRELPLGSGERHARAFERLGWTRKPKAGKGSHIVMTKGNRRVTIPGHREVKRNTLGGLLVQAGVSIAEYLRVYR